MDIVAYLEAQAKQQKTLVDEQLKLIQQQIETEALVAEREKQATLVSELALKREEYIKSILDFIVKNKFKILIGGVVVLFLLLGGKLLGGQK